MNHKEDKSFFTLLHVPTPVNLDYIVSWFFKNPSSRYRLIIDDEVYDNYMNLKHIHEVYPEIKTIAVVCNPWDRLYQGYEYMLEHLNNEDTHDWLDEFDCKNGFDKYVESLFEIENYKNISYWWLPTTQQYEWLEYVDDLGQTKKVDYVLKAEEMSTYFKPLQAFFESDVAFTYDYKNTDYRPHYSDYSKEMVYRHFKDDIEKYNYEF